MPNFQKSKGFQLRSGNKAKAPFKMMGSSPAKQSIFGPSKLDLKSANDGDSTVEKVSEKVTGPKTPKKEPKKIKVADAKFDASKATVSGDAKDNIKTRGKKQNASKVTDSADRSELDVAKSEGRANRAEEKKQKKLDRANETLEEKTARKEKFAQAARDAGALVSKIGGGSLVEEIQSQADRKTNKVNKDIQNEKDRVNTARTQQLVDATNKAGTEGEKVSSTKSEAVNNDGTASVNSNAESSAEKIANAKAVKAGTKVKNSDGTYSPSSPAEYKRKK
jgi:hypothetical protein